MAKFSDEIVLEVQSLVDDAKFPLALKTIRRVRGAIPLRKTSVMADLARQAGDPSLALKLLRRYLKPESQSPSGCEKEWIVYAASLIRVGAVSEGIRLLKRLDPQIYPTVNLFLVHAYFARWDYQSSIPLLLKFKDQITEMRLRVAMGLNLAACYVNERENLKALEVLEETEEIALRHKQNGFLGSVHELRCQIFLRTGQMGEALKSAEQAHRLLKETNSVFALFVRKWRAVIEAKESGRCDSLLSVRQQAIDLSHWETVRHIDALVSIERKDPELFLKVYFGTPNEQFREHLFRDFGRAIEIPKVYSWHPEGSSTSTRTISPFFDPDSANTRLLRVFCSDHFRPHSVGQLHEKVFAGEYYNPASSPQRVYQAILRLREYFRREQLSLSVEHQGVGYRLAFSGPLTIMIPRWTSDIHSRDRPEHRLSDEFEERHFTAQQASQVLGVSQRSARRYLSQLLEEGRLTRIGSGPGTTYQFSSQKNAA